MSPVPPKVFISYSHDSQEHKDWVLTLSTRLQANGVNVILDQWDLTLGSDLPRFMESGLTDADRVLSVCSGAYVKKSNDGIGGAGYEKMILTGELMKNLASDKVIPGNSGQLERSSCPNVSFEPPLHRLSKRRRI